MSSSSQHGIIDYRSTFFDYPTLTKISGEPSLSTLMTLRNELKANAQSVDTNLGGGAHGHLGLVVPASVYNNIAPDTPYIKPRQPTLRLTNSDSQYVLAEKRHTYDKNLQVYKECVAMERILIQQIINAVEPKYLKPLRDSVTNKLNQSIPNILQYLFDTYGDVSPQEFLTLRHQLETMTFDPQDPVDVIFTEIDELAEVADAIGDPLTDVQQTKIGYVVLQNTKRFSSGLKKWDEKQLADKTWTNFKTHFRLVQKNMRRTGVLSVNEAMNHDDMINAVSQNVLDNMQAILNMQDSSEPPGFDQDPSEPQQESVLLALADKVEKMGEQLVLLQQQKQPWQHPYYPPPMGNSPPMFCPPGYPMGPHHQVPAPPGGPSSGSRPTSSQKRSYHGRYCWSCGACDHWGNKCPAKKPGHINKASFKDKKGGSTANCRTA